MKRLKDLISKFGFIRRKKSGANKLKLTDVYCVVQHADLSRLIMELSRVRIEYFAPIWMISDTNMATYSNGKVMIAKLKGVGQKEVSLNKFIEMLESENLRKEYSRNKLIFTLIIAFTAVAGCISGMLLFLYYVTL